MPILFIDRPATGRPEGLRSTLLPAYLSSNPGRGSRPSKSFAAAMFVIRMFAAS